MITDDCMHMAGRFLEQQGRKLDLALYNYYLKGGSQDLVIDALKEYQNSDGGFGRALEPDVRLEASSILATTIAFQFLRPLALATTHEIVQKGVNYFIDSFDHKKVGWEIVPSYVDDAPHAPWWKYNSDIESQWANPRAEILGYLYEYESITPVNLRETLLSNILERLTKIDSLEMHEVQCFVRLLEAPNLPTSARNTVFEKLNDMLPNIVETNPDKWNQYCLRPLDVVSSPGSPLYKPLETVIDENIEFLIGQQHSDGSWPPAWSWAFVDASAWKQALADLKSSITLNNLLKLGAFSKERNE